jgi:hypothetical protein
MSRRERELSDIVVGQQKMVGIGGSTKKASYAEEGINKEGNCL